MSDNPISIKLQADIKDFIKSLYDAEKATQSFGKNTAKNISGANYALQSVSRVAQDLPFGFIAIQNNITPLFDSFAQLSKDSGSAKNAFKALASSIAGPAGIALAVGVVSGLLTSIVKEYGSLTNALNVLTSTNREATKSQLEYNKELSKTQASANVQINTLNQLSKNYNDSSKGVQAQLAAFVQLKKIQPDIAAGITQENALTAKNIQLVNQRTNSYISLLQVQAKQSAIQSVVQKNEEEIVKLQQEKFFADQKVISAQNEMNYAMKVGAYQSLSALSVGLKSNQKESQNLEKRIKVLTDVNKQYYDQLNPIIQQISAYNKKQEDTSISIKKTDKATKDAEKALNDYLEAQKKMLQNRTQDAMIDFTSFFKLDPEDARKRIKNLLDKVQKEIDLAGFGEAAKTQGAVKAGIQVYKSENVLQDERNLALFTAKAQTYLSVLTPVIDSVFGAIENGQNAFKALGQSVKQFVIELVKALLKTAALAALISIFSGGKISFGAAFKGVTSANGGLLGLGGAVAPSIGGAGGISGGMQLAGNVVFVQRGYDLVGVLNASNSSINNIG